MAYSTEPGFYDFFPDAVGEPAVWVTQLPPPGVVNPFVIPRVAYRYYMPEGGGNLLSMHRRYLCIANVWGRDPVAVMEDLGVVGYPMVWGQVVDNYAIGFGMGMTPLPGGWWRVKAYYSTEPLGSEPERPLF